MEDIPKIGITGMPNVGKTQTLVKVMEFLQDSGYKVGGMVTEPLLEKEKRIGFYVKDWQTGEKEVFAHIDFDSKDKVGDYGVDLSVLEKVGVPAIEKAIADTDVDVIIIDEIGKMELFSNRFRSLIHEVLNSDKQVFASIALKGEGFIREIKRRSDIHLLEVIQGNREHLPDAILEGF